MRMTLPFACESVRLTSNYDYRTLNGKREFHPGYDLVGVGSKDIVAVVGGTVVQSRIVTDKNNPTWQWGNYVCIKGTDGRYYYYCHMSCRTVVKGQAVEAGDKLGIMGNTGYSFGAHLHFEIRESDARTTVCPEDVTGIPNNEGTYTVQKSQFEEDIGYLEKRKVVNPASYWLQRENIDPYFDDLIHNYVECSKKLTKLPLFERSSVIFEALDIMNPADFWIKRKNIDPYFDDLVIKMIIDLLK